MPRLCRPKSMSLCCVLLTLPLATMASADDIVEQIEIGLERYQEQDYPGAITELEFAINDLRKLMAARIGETFPEPPDGWTAGETSSDGGAMAAAAMFGGGGTLLERGYQQEDGDGSVNATLMIDNPMIQSMAAMFNNPALMAAQPNTDRVRIGRETAMLEWNPERDSGKISMMLDGRILMQLEGRHLSSQDVLVDMLAAWDLDALRTQAAR